MIYPPGPWHYEQSARLKGFSIIAGIDEAGRGPLAGPVVAAAVVLPQDAHLDGVTDSKQLSPARRNRLYDVIYREASGVGIGIVDAGEIDRINILQASLLAMRFAVENLDPRPDCLLIDGTCRIPMPQTVAGSPFQQAIPKGDRLSISISAASIVAKVTRDRMMAQYHEQYPQYNFARHKGYPTEQHRQAIRTSGICFIHRRSFQGVLESTCKRSPINSENPGKVLRQITFENAGISSSS